MILLDEWEPICSFATSSQCLYSTSFNSSSGILELSSFRRAEWQKRVMASLWFKIFSLYVWSNLRNTNLDVTKILYLSIPKLNFWIRDSHSDHTSSKTSSMGPSCTIRLMKYSSWLIASSLFWNWGGERPLCWNIFWIMSLRLAVFETVTKNVLFP